MKSILIDDVEYVVLTSEADDIWGVLDILKPKQAHIGTMIGMFIKL